MAAFYENKSINVYARNSEMTKKTLGYTSHLHYHIELALVTEGKTRVTIDNSVYDVEAGDIIIVFPNQVHRFDTIEREKYILLIVNPDIISELTRMFTSFLPQNNLIKGGALCEDLWYLASKISDEYYGNESFREEILRGYLLAFFGRILQKMQLKDIESKESNVLGLILNYCINNYDKNISLEILEKELHISKYYISHTMSNRLHMGFNDYINSIRVSNACKYLKKTDKSITEISDLVGFNTMRTFNRAFQKQMNMTPSEYRAKK